MSDFQLIAIVVVLFVILDAMKYFKILKLQEKVERLEFRNDLNNFLIKGLKKELRRCRGE